jgi:hypothetical protein
MPAFDVRPATQNDLDLLSGRPDVAPHALDDLRARKDGWRGIAAFHRGRLVGFRAARTTTLRNGADRYACGVFTVNFLEETYRAGGAHAAFVEIDEAFEEAFEGRGDGRYAVVVGRIDESDFWFLRAHRGFAPVRTDVDLVLDRAESARLRASDATVVPFDASRKDAFATPLAFGEIATERDFAEVAARARGGKAFLVLDASGAPRAVAITRDSGGEREIVDWAVAEGDEPAADALLLAAIEGARGVVRVPAFCRSPWLLHFQRAGFRVRPSVRGGVVEPYVAARATIPRLSADKLGEHWCATAADVPAEPLPRGAFEVDVVDPPPPGTRVARDE